MVRFIFYGGSREVNLNGSIRLAAIDDNSAFHFAALNVARDYADWNQTGQLLKIDCADTIVRIINGQAASSVKSLDILSQGSEITLDFSVVDDRNCGFYTSRAAALGNNIYGFFSDAVNAFDARGRSIAAIDYTRFTNDARIQLHGNEISSRNNLIVNNLAKEFSNLLAAAGKSKAVVISHAVVSNPQIREEGNTRLRLQRYRHGKRLIYNNGLLVFTTTRSGYIPDSLIARQLNQ